MDYDGSSRVHNIVKSGPGPGRLEKQQVLRGGDWCRC